MSYLVLVVEDDDTLRDTLEYNLVNQGYRVITADNGYKALELARGRQPDVLLLDLMLPGLNGFEVCRILRKEMSLPILMLTARMEEVDKILGLEVGADDYLTKPFSMRELLARVKALLRRVELIRDDLAAAQESAGPDGPRPAAGPYPAPQTISKQGKPEKPREERQTSLLLFLARHHGMALSRDLLLERVWGWSYDGNSRTVDVHVRWLREKIEPDPANAVRIVTVRGIGYRFDG